MEIVIPVRNEERDLGPSVRRLCGFKAIQADQARALLPLTSDTGWFFDSELLVLAERAGLRIHEVPVDWIEDPDSRVHVLHTTVADLRGIIRPPSLMLTAVARSCSAPSTAGY